MLTDLKYRVINVITQYFTLNQQKKKNFEYQNR